MASRMRPSAGRVALSAAAIVLTAIVGERRGDGALLPPSLLAPSLLAPQDAATRIAPFALPRRGEAAGQSPVYRTAVELVHTSVVVTDRRGRLISDLRIDDFEISEDGVPQQLQYFALGDASSGPPLHVGVLLDVSESMAADIGFTRSAAIRFLQALEDAQDVTVVDFDTEIRSARFGPSDFPRLVERVRSQKVSGFTALYDALGVYLDSAAGQEGRKVMLLYSDGGDTRSALRFPELLELLRASDVTVYVVGAVDRRAPTARTEPGTRLSRIAETTGGRAFFPHDIRELDKTYAEVLSEIRAQYTLGYASKNDRRDGAWRRVTVKVRRSDVRVRARQGYFAPAAR